MATRDQTIEKIRKLLSLANSPNENEANTANAQAQRLISQFQIEQAEIDARAFVKLEIISLIIPTGSKSNILWKENLISCLSKVNNCDFYTQKKYSGEVSPNNPEKLASAYTIYLVVGSKSNVELVEILFNLILGQVEYFAKEFVPSEKSRTVGKAEKNSFRLGIVTRICQRLRESKDSVIKEHIALKGTTSTALVFIEKEKEEIQLFVKQLFGKVKFNPKRKTNIRQEAYQAGIKQGDKVALTNNKALK